MSNKVIRAHDPAWSALYEAEAATLVASIGQNVVCIDHIGGTSIPAILTKPVIDILVQVTDLFDLEVRTPELVRLGYEARGEYGIPGRRYFSRKTAMENISGYHVHVYQRGSENAFRHIAFRDFLRLHPQIAREYSELKRSLADPSGVLPSDYAELKSGFVQNIERQALAYFR